MWKYFQKFPEIVLLQQTSGTGVGRTVCGILPLMQQTLEPGWGAVHRVAEQHSMLLFASSRHAREWVPHAHYLCVVAETARHFLH